MPKQEIDGIELFDLALAVVGEILNEGEQKVSDLAERFEVSEKVILKAVHTITDSEDLAEYWTHFHLNFEELEGGWVSFRQENTKLDGPPLLSKRQVTSIAIGLDYLASLPQFSGNPQLQGLRKQLAASEEVPVTSVLPGRFSQLLEEIHQAIEKSVSIECEYRNQKGEQSLRKIDPLLIELRGRKHYLRAWCHTNREVRSFRLDRMQKVSITEDPIAESSKTATIPEEIYGERLDEQTVTISAEPEAAEIFWNFPLVAEPELKAGKYVGKIRVGGLEGLPRHIVRYGGLVEVLEPANARELVVAFAKASLEDGQTPRDED